MLCMLDITAAGQDYHAVSNMYLGPFSNDDRRQCFTVNILNDTQSESPEYFMVSVQLCPGDKPERVDINPSSANITIIDDDGELLIWKTVSSCLPSSISLSHNVKDVKIARLYGQEL